MVTASEKICPAIHQPDMTRIFVAHRLNIIITVMYQTIDDKKAGKAAKSHVFPDYKTLQGLLIRLCSNSRCQNIIDSSQGILDYLAIL